MNFSVRQWVLSIVLDMLIKIVIVSCLGVLLTLSAAPIAGFVCLAILLSVLHLACLFLGNTFAVSFELFHIQVPRLFAFVLVLIATNVLFVGGFVSFAVLKDHGGTPPALESGLTVGLFLMVTNIVPILSVAACSCAYRRLRLSC